METSAEQVFQEVKKAIATDDRFATTFEPFADGLHQEHGFWMVSVRLQRFEPAQRRMELYALFAKLESFLQSEKHLNVVLLPVITSITS